MSGTYEVTVATRSISVVENCKRRRQCRNDLRSRCVLLDVGCWLWLTRDANKGALSLASRHTRWLITGRKRRRSWWHMSYFVRPKSELPWTSFIDVLPQYSDVFRRSSTPLVGYDGASKFTHILCSKAAVASTSKVVGTTRASFLEAY